MKKPWASGFFDSTAVDRRGSGGQEDFRGRPRPRPPAAFAPYQEEYSNELRNCFFAPHLRHVPVDSGPLGASILQWQLPPSSWHLVSSSTSSSCSSSICFLADLRLEVFLVVMAVPPVES